MVPLRINIFLWLKTINMNWSKFILEVPVVSFSKIVLSFILCVLFTACASEEDEAKRLGFSSIDEMKSIQKMGWHTKAQHENDKAKALGYSSAKEMADALVKSEDERKRQIKMAAVAAQAKETEKALNDMKRAKADGFCVFSAFAAQELKGISLTEHSSVSYANIVKLIEKWAPVVKKYQTITNACIEGKSRVIAEQCITEKIQDPLAREFYYGNIEALTKVSGFDMSQPGRRLNLITMVNGACLSN